MIYYLAIDIGASSGRHMLVSKDKGLITTEEIYRFKNQMINTEGSLCWDVDCLFNEVINGIACCKEIGKIPYSVSIDTWGADYVLLDKNDKIIGKTYAYRDLRTRGMDDIVKTIISDRELYKRTGTQKQLFNTIYQLMASKTIQLDILEQASTFLMMPDYLHYRLTGIKTNEYTNATTTGLVNCNTNDWDYDLIDMLGLTKHIFQPLKMPMHTIGYFKDEISNELGFNCKVVACATHDTGSAIVAAPVDGKKSVYISSGTWSLLGVENDEPIVSEDSQIANFTNEGGFNYKYRYLKNIMGLWIIQCVYHEFDEKYSYAQICEMAEAEDIRTILDCNDSRFFSPKSMVDEIKQYAKETNQQVPESIGEIAAVVYNSLAVCYRNAIEEIQNLTGVEYSRINIIGGGSNAEYLNKLAAQATGLKVVAGPTEATAFGNALCQMIANDEFKNVEEARKCIEKSFNLKEYGGVK